LKAGVELLTGRRAPENKISQDTFRSPYREGDGWSAAHPGCAAIEKKKGPSSPPEAGPLKVCLPKSRFFKPRFF
jgi:hypothetical protein